LKKALVLAIVMVLGLGTLAFAGPLSGAWESEICFGVLSYGEDALFGLTGLTSTLTIDYSVCGWEFESVSGIDFDGWTTQTFTAGGALGAFTFDSEVEFAPAAALFTLWDSSVGVSIAGVNINSRYVLIEDSWSLTGYSSGWVFNISGEAGLCSLGADVYFNSWPFLAYTYTGPQTTSVVSDLWIFPGNCFCFSAVEFYTSFPFCCVEEVEMSVAFSMFGFEGVQFSVYDIEMPGLAWITFDANLEFDDGVLGGKKLTLTPGLNLGDSICFDIYADLVVDGNVISGLNVYGIGLECDMGQGVTFSSITALDWPFHFIPVGAPFDESEWEVVDVPDEEGSAFVITSLADLCCGEVSYWEKFSISSSSDACCGGAFGFDLDVYFSKDFLWATLDEEGELLAWGWCIHPWLFDVARIDAEFSVGLGSNFALTGGVSVVDLYYDVDLGCTPLGLSEFCIGFEVTF
jgi:hypothetical protein